MTFNSRVQICLGDVANGQQTSCCFSGAKAEGEGLTDSLIAAAVCRRARLAISLYAAPSKQHLLLPAFGSSPFPNQRKIPVGTSHQSRQGWRAGNGVDLITYVILQFKSSFSFDRAGVWSGCGRCSREQGTCKQGQRDHHLSQRGEHAVPTENPDQCGRLRGILFFPGALTCQCPSACAALQHLVVLLYKGSHLLFFFSIFFVLCASSRH